MFILNCIIVFLVSMVPIVELRGAIPIGVGLGVPEILALIIAVIGNMIPVPFIYKFSRKLLELGSKSSWKWIKKFCDFCLKKGEKAGKKLMKRGGDSIYLGLFLFVGIPLPGTGAWTGALIASLFGIRMKYSLPTIFAGVLLAGAIMTFASYGFLSFLNVFI